MFKQFVYAFCSSSETVFLNYVFFNKSYFHFKLKQTLQFSTFFEDGMRTTWDIGLFSEISIIRDCKNDI